MPNERFKTLFYLLRFGQFWSRPKDFCCNLQCGHNFNFTVVTCFSNLLFQCPAFLVATYELMLRPEKFSDLPEQSNSQQFQFTKSNQNKYNSIHLNHSNIQQIDSICIDSCHGRVSGINKICFLCSSYCRSQTTAA